jgi:hypothetical protein
MTPEEQLNQITGLCTEAQLVDEAGQKVVHLPQMSFKTATGESTQDLLFVPFPHSGYDSRLFFSEDFGGWGQHNIINRTWWAPSYRVDTSLSWRDQILQHIKVVTP